MSISSYSPAVTTVSPLQWQTVLQTALAPDTNDEEPPVKVHPPDDSDYWSALGYDA